MGSLRQVVVAIGDLAREIADQVEAGTHRPLIPFQDLRSVVKSIGRAGGEDVGQARQCLAT